MSSELSDIAGSRGERIAELRLTELVDSTPLFRPVFLGDKWPVTDYLVELLDVVGRRPYFFVQVKTTTSELTPRSKH